MAILPLNDPVVSVKARQGKTGAHPLRSLIATILDQHHAYLKNELAALEGLVKACAGSGSDNCRAAAVELLPIFLRFRKELEAHMKREEVILFPLIERLELAISENRPAPRNSFGPLGNAIQFMNEDHGFENKLFGMMAVMTDDFASPHGASGSYTGLMDRLKAMKLDLAEHIRKEDEMLFPEAIRLEKGEHLSE
ncbi:MAG TPA: hemerythrin domain-containing protein [Terriglobales bacterium]|nr:hemerythrin domain-containing protein [Terriglobales bacterium]